MKFTNNYCYLTQTKVVKFPYFIIINEKDIFETRMEIKKLKGEAEGNIKLWTFDRLEYFRAMCYVRKNNIRHWKPKSLVSQFRIATKDKYKLYPDDYRNLNTLTIDIETTGLNPEEDSVFLIVCDYNGELSVFIDNSSEFQLLKKFQDYISEKDIDVIVGHNITTFDIPFLARRFEKLLNKKLSWNGHNVYQSQHYSRIQYRYGHFQYKKIYINNIDIVDTMFMVMSYDMIKRECQNYKLKYLEEHFGLIDLNERVYCDYDEFKLGHLTKKIIKYCQQDVQSTKKLYEMFIPSYYYQLLYFPMSLQDMIFSTIVPKWDSLIVMEYLKQDYSIPLPIKEEDIEGVKFEGAITGCLKKGLIRNVRKIDVASLYPSIIIKHHIKSDKDYLDIAYQKFVKITEDRLWYKARKKENKLYDYIQSALKYIINPYFGYLGNEYSLYSNIDGASKITELGRHYLTQILEIMEKNGAEIIEIDTDGVIYSGPKMADMINRDLPKEIQVEDEGFWSKMISYSKKNYILYVAQRNWVKKGVFFKSSSMNKLKRDFVDDFIDCIFENKNIENLLRKYYIKITTGQCTVEELQQRFRANMTIEEYKQSLLDNANKNPQLPYEYFIRNNIELKLEEVVYLYKKIKGKKYETMEIAEKFDGVYDADYYLKMVFDFITKIYKNAPEILPKNFIDKYDQWRYTFTGVKTRKRKKGEKENE